MLRSLRLPRRVLSVPSLQSLSLSQPVSVAPSLPSACTRSLSHVPLFRPAVHLHLSRASYTPSSRSLSSQAETMEFQAETRKLLDIVTNSIYTDKEVFIRELISNASDALEKYRYNQVKGSVLPTATNTSPEIRITANSIDKTLVIEDSGIGMTREELISNLGTIARSGSKAFVEEAKQKGEGSTEGIIGQFGVGFYASFMVADEVIVDSVSAISASDNTPRAHRWTSQGYGNYTIQSLDNVEGLQHGTRITLKLKSTCEDFLETDKLKSIVQRYSNFVSFPIKLNNDVLNTVSAIWTKAPSEVTEPQYKDFFRFLAHSDNYRYKLHYRTDAPIDLKCLFYIPEQHEEKYGLGRMQPGVNLYSRKVLIEARPRDLLPDWCRFIKGVVDSEDLPLSLSREKPQDSALLRRIRDTLVRKLLRYLSDEAKNRPEDYEKFYQEYHVFLKEGVCSDYAYMELLSKLLRFESNQVDGGKLISLDDYISRCAPEQKEVYYLVAPSRSAALASPYYESFKVHNKEVLLLYNAIDEFVMSNLKSYAGRDLVSAETSNIDFGSAPEKEAEKKEEDSAASSAATKLTDTEAQELCGYLSLVLGQKVRSVKVTHRLHDSPAIVTDHESAALRRMMRLVVSTTYTSVDSIYDTSIYVVYLCILLYEIGTSERRQGHGSI
jgi:TNF receptor-associated protein 1